MGRRGLKLPGSRQGQVADPCGHAMNFRVP